MNNLVAQDLFVGYTKKMIIENLNVTIPEGEITTIIGSNGCGKSTLLKTMSRILKHQNGLVLLDGKDIHSLKTQDLAKRIAILPQSSECPAGLTIEELITYGRFPHQKRFSSISKEDQAIIDWAIEATGLAELRTREVDYLSGGQRQRAWIAMALAQDTPIIFLDEPTTYLDLANQLDILKLLKQLNETSRKTIIMVLHDLNHASRFSHFLIAMKDGQIVKTGAPQEVMTRDTLKKVFNIEATITTCPYSQNPICLTYDSTEEAHLQILPHAVAIGS